MKHYDIPAPPDRFVTGDPPDIGNPDPFRRLVAIMDRLRGPGGCPWDREQTHDSLKQYLIEESHEVLGAIEERHDNELRDELGDVALQVVFHAQLAAEENRFGVDDVYRAICEKLIRRHPHVFGDIQANNSGQVLRNWEQIKLAERAAKEAQPGHKPAEAAAALPPLFKGIPKHLPALQRAARVQEKAARTGFDWRSLKPVLEKVREELAEWSEELDRYGVADAPNPQLDPARLGPAAALPVPPEAVAQRGGAVEEELGDLLFALVNAARFLKLEPEEALQRATDKFMNRYGRMEALAQQAGAVWERLSLEEMDSYWESAKVAEPPRA